MLKCVGMGLAGIVFIVTVAPAADLDTFRAPPQVIEGVGPPRFVRRPLPPSPCHVIATPRFNLSQDDVVRTTPEVVCLSRGLYTDSFGR
jgi:hypothetical protein